MSLIRSKQRVADHDEGITPPWMVVVMLDPVKSETERIDSENQESRRGRCDLFVDKGRMQTRMACYRVS